MNEVVTGKEFKLSKVVAEAQVLLASASNSPDCPDDIALVALLKGCLMNKDVQKGLKVPAEICETRLLKVGTFMGNCIVDLHCKRGALTKAQQVFDELPLRNVSTWNTLIRGYSQHEHALEVLKCFDGMRQEGLSPDSFTFIYILKACGSLGAVEKGKRIHAEVAREGLLRTNCAIGNILMDMYFKCGAVDKAKQVFDGLPSRNLITWNVLISGYSQHGYGQEALNCYEQMRRQGLHPDEVTFISICKACGSIGALKQGKDIHAEIAKNLLLKDSTQVCNALLDMYCKCGLLLSAKEIFDKISVRDVISYNVFIAAYSQHGHGEEALKCFEQMQKDGFSPDAATFACVLKACGTIEAAEKGHEIHAEIARQGLLRKNKVLGNALIDMYCKCNEIGKAQQVFDELPVHDIVSWNSLIAGYSQQECCEQALNCFEQMKHENVTPDAATFACILKACGNKGMLERGKDIHMEIAKRGMLKKNNILGNALVDMYGRCGSIGKAQEVFDELDARDVISYNGLMTGYCQQGCGDEVLVCFRQMQEEDIMPNTVTFLCILKACGGTGSTEKGKEIHAEISKKEFLGIDTSIGNALVDMYSKCGALAMAQEVFDELPVRNVISWNTLIAAYAQNECAEEVLNCFEVMKHENLSPDAATFVCILKACGSIGAAEKGKEIHHILVEGGWSNKNNALGNVLIDMYAKCGALLEAHQVFRELPARNLVSWNSLIGGYSQHGHGAEALDCFEEMKGEGIIPNSVTFLCILQACGIVGAAAKGSELHSEIARQGLLGKDSVLGTALVDMYAKCGMLQKAQAVFNALPVHDLLCWNTLIGGYAQHGYGEEALDCFGKMQLEDVSPDSATFLCLLSACSRSGLVNEGSELFDSMISNHGITPSIEHVTCIVLLFANGGHFDKAAEMIEKMPLSEHLPLWNALLSACRKWANVELGKWAFEHALQVHEDCAVSYTCMQEIYACMQEIYAAAGMQESADSIEGLRMQLENRWEETDTGGYTG